MAKDYKELCKEIREGVERAIMIGPMHQVHARLDRALDEFEAGLLAYVDDEAIKRARTYYEQMSGVPDGEPVFDKDKECDKTED